MSAVVLAVSLFCTEPLRAAGPEKQASDTRGPSLVDSVRFKQPVTLCGVTLPLDRAPVRERLEKEMLLSLWDRPQVLLWLKRSGRYFPLIEKELAAAGLPDDLKYVPVVESGLRPHASSSKRAVGYWQFLKSTGRRYGLRVDSNVDERRNIEKSTRAACRYLKDLNKALDDYVLAMAAYNMGEFGLKKAMKTQNGKEFFSLYLPLETQRYIFKIAAAKLIFENRALYGFHLKPDDYYKRPAFDRVNFTSKASIPISLIAGAAGVPFKTIKDMNPELRGYDLGRGKTTIIIPKGRASAFKERFERHYKSWEQQYRSRIHVVKKGENLSGIAKRYRVSVSSLLRLNNLSRKGIIRPGDRIRVE